MSDLFTQEPMHHEVLRHIVMVNYSAKSIIIAFCMVLIAYSPAINGEAMACAVTSLATMWLGQIWYTAFWTPWKGGGITNFFKNGYFKENYTIAAILVGCIIYYAGFAVFYICAMLNSTYFVELNPILTASTYAVVVWHFYLATAFALVTLLWICNV